MCANGRQVHMNHMKTEATIVVRTSSRTE
jgi:hypothetical protein